VRQDNGTSYMPAGAGWGLVTSDQQVAIFVNELAPAIVNNAYGGYTTGIGLNNTSASMTTATVNYSDQAGTTLKTQTVDLPAHGYAGLYSGDAFLPCPWASPARPPSQAAAARS